MAIEVKLPQFGDGIDEAVIIKRLVEIGSSVKTGDIIFEIQTDKVNLELPSPDSGIVKLVLVEEDQTVNAGDTLLVLGGQDEKIDENVFSKKSKPAGLRPAKNFDGDILDGLAKITPEKMLWSKQNIPCFYLNISIDAFGIISALQKSPKETTVDDFIIKAMAIGFEKWPVMTGRLQNGSIVFTASPAIGIVMDSYAPVIKDVCRKSIPEITAARLELLKKTNEGKLADDDLSGGCMTICNVGNFGIESVIPVVLPGQCSILGVGAITQTQTGKNIKLTLAVDHKIANGAEAAQFFSLTAKLLEEAEKNAV